MIKMEETPKEKVISIEKYWKIIIIFLYWGWFQFVAGLIVGTMITMKLLGF